MALTPPNTREFLKKNGNIDLQAENRVEVDADLQAPRNIAVGDEDESKDCSYKALVEEVRRLKLEVTKSNSRIQGLKALRRFDHRAILNPNWQDIEYEVGAERLSNPKTNYVQNSAFRLWNSGVTLPLGWTSTNAPTLSRVTARTGAQGGNYAVRVASGGSAGYVSRTFRVKGGAKYKLGGWVKIASGATATIVLVTNGASPVTITNTMVGSLVGAAGWFSFPRPMFESMDIETPADATNCTVRLQASANGTVDFSDIQVVQGVRCDPDLWEPAPEDIEQITGMGNLPTGYGSSGQVLSTDGSGVTSWATPAGAGVSVLYATMDQVGTTAVTSEETLASYSVPGGTLTAEDQSLIVTAWGRVASNGNTKTIRLRFGATATILAVNDISTAPNGQSWRLAMNIGLRTAPQTWSGSGEMVVGAVQQSVATQFPNNDSIAGNITIGVSGQNGTASANDIVLDGFMIELAA